MSENGLDEIVYRGVDRSSEIIRLCEKKMDGICLMKRIIKVNTCIHEPESFSFKK